MVRVVVRVQGRGIPEGHQVEVRACLGRRQLERMPSSAAWSALYCTPTTGLGRAEGGSWAAFGENLLRKRDFARGAWEKSWAGE